MIRQSFETLILPILRDSMPSYLLLDKWDRERPTILLSEIAWFSPVTISRNGWVGLKNFEGQITICLYSDRNKQLDPFPLIKRIVNPLTKSLDNQTPSGEDDCEYQWFFSLQREDFCNMTYEVQLEGEIQGSLFTRE